MTDLEINEAVARQLGWVKIKADGTWFKARSFDIEKQRQPSDLYRDYMVNVKGEKEVKTLPDYCHSIKAAWEICNWLIERNYTWALSYSTLFGKEYTFVIFEIVDQLADDKADTAPMAICRAFLKLP